MALYHRAMYDVSRPVGSYWETTAPSGPSAPALQGDVTCDIAVIGGGYTGISAALHLAKDSDLDVCVLEAGPLGWGASGRNGGFCTLHPSGLGLRDLARRYGVQATRSYINAHLEAIQLVEELAASENIDIQRQGDGIMQVAHAPARYDQLRKEKQDLEYFGIAADLFSADEFAERFYRSNEQFGAMKMRAGFGLHPLRFMRGLAAAAIRHGAKAYPHSPVLEWDKSLGWHVLRTPGGRLRARHVIVATNGFTEDHLHPGLAGRLMPIISNIVTTRPLTDDECAAQGWQTDIPCSNTRNLLFYFRMLPDRRFLFGARGDLTGHPADGARMRDWMVRRLGEVFPAWKHVEIEHYWRGFVCMTAKMTPAVGYFHDDRSVLYGLAYHGDGVAAAPWTGRILSKILTGKATPADIPLPMRGPAPAIPFPSLRRWYARGAIAYYKWRDSK